MGRAWIAQCSSEVIRKNIMSAGVSLYMSFIVVDKRDNVATSIADLGKGEIVEAGEWIVVLIEDIKYGHKFALKDIPLGEYVVKYGERIGRATKPIPKGTHVHIQNVEDIVDEVRKL